MSTSTEPTADRGLHAMPLNILTIEGDRPNEIAQVLHDLFGVDGEVLADRVIAATDEGHALLPKIVEAFPPGRLHAVSLRSRTQELA